MIQSSGVRTMHRAFSWERFTYPSRYVTWLPGGSLLCPWCYPRSRSCPGAISVLSSRRKDERTLSNTHLKVPSYEELARHECGNTG